MSGGAGPYTTLATSPVTEEEPFLYTDASGGFRVFVPAVQHDSSGPTWTSGQTPGTSLPISRFFIASPDTPVAEINLRARAGLEPGPDSWRLQPRPAHRGEQAGHDRARPRARDPDPDRRQLVDGRAQPGRGQDLRPDLRRRAGQLAGAARGRAVHRSRAARAAPTLIQDTYFRIGGAEPGEATSSLVVNSSHAILDNIWGWRADHGNGVGWTDNVGEHGLIVNGNDVTAYGLFIEHYEKTQVIWRGQGGTTIFFQNELPYDPPSQAAWMAERHDRRVSGVRGDAERAQLHRLRPG